MEGAFESRLSKWLAVAFSSLVMLLTSPMFFSIISYEGNIHYRVLIGRLVSSSISTMLFWNATVQVKQARIIGLETVPSLKRNPGSKDYYA